jgi:hypothetical protein
MASNFNVEFTMREAPGEAQATAASGLSQPARQLGLRQSKQSPGQLEFRPRVGFPLLLSLYRVLSGERMTVTFEPAASGGTSVSINGAVSRSKVPLASDPEHWTEGLGGAASA